MRSEKLLKEYVRHIIAEDGYDMGMMGMGDMPGGIAFGGPSLYQTFIKPFVNVGKVALAGAEKIAARTKAAIRVAVEGTLSTLIPFLEAEYDKIFEAEEKDLALIKEKYADLFNEINQ